MKSAINTIRLAQQLQAQGYWRFLMGKLGDDEFCLIQANGQWQVVYSERGFVREVLYTTTDEASACGFFYRQISSMRHDHLVGAFASQAEAVAMGAMLQQLGVKHHLKINTTQSRTQHQVFVYDHNVFLVEHTFGQCLLHQMPSTITMLKQAIARIHDFDWSLFPLRSPVSAAERQVWLRLEQALGIVIPSGYANFLQYVANGGHWHNTTRYFGYEKLLQHNNAGLWVQKLPDFLHDLLQAPPESSIERPITDTSDYPGLLRISHWSYNSGAFYLNKQEAIFYIEIMDKNQRISLAYPNLDAWQADLLAEVQQKVLIFDRTLVLMRSGATLTDVLAAFPNNTGQEKRTAIIANLLGVAPVELEQKLLAWQEREIYGGV
jgi:hypothetical protein